MFILLPLLDNHIIEKQDSKKNLLEYISISNFKIVFTLLAKMILVKI